VALGSLFKTLDTKLGSTFASKPTSRKVAFLGSAEFLLTTKISSDSSGSSDSIALDIRYGILAS